jgi:hypothetical protein
MYIIPVVFVECPQIKIQSTSFRDKKGNYVVAMLIFILTKSSSITIFQERPKNALIFCVFKNTH